MTLKEANKELEKLDNEYTYWLNQKETLLNLVYPKATDIKPEIIQGGKREDRLLKYIELEDEKQINATLDYIHKRKNNLMNWMENELKIIGEYEPVERKILMLRDEKKAKWKDIARNVGYCERQCQRIYDKYKKRTKKRRNYL